MNIDPHYQQQKCRPKIAVSTEVRFMRIFSGVRWGGASNEGGVGFLATFDQYVAISKTLRDRVIVTIEHYINRKLYTIYRMVLFPMTLIDP